MYKLPFLAFYIFISLSSFAQQTTVKIDISELDQSGYEELMVRTNHGFTGIDSRNHQSVTVDQLPTLIELFALEDLTATHKMYIWVTQPKIKVSGSIKMQTLAVSPRTEFQSIADKILLNIYTEKEDESFQYSAIYSLLFYRDRLNVPFKRVRQYIDEAPESVHNFWGFQKLENYLKSYDETGYDLREQRISHFQASLENGEDILFERPENKPLLISFLAASCNCVEEIKQISSLKKSLKKELEIVTLWHSYSGVPIGLYLNDENEIMSWKSLWDKDILITRKLGIKSESEYILFGTDGKILKRWKKPPKNLNRYLSKD